MVENSVLDSASGIETQQISLLIFISDHISEDYRLHVIEKSDNLVKEPECIIFIFRGGNRCI